IGRPLAGLRQEARAQISAAARQYLEETGEPVSVPNEGPLFVAGHQPELFHPGVWVKSFALAGMARRHRGASINLIVDHGPAKHPALRMPSMAMPNEAPIVTVPFGRWASEVPYEERSVQDENQLASFPERATAVYRHWNFDPLLPVFWAEVLRHSQRT